MFTALSTNDYYWLVVTEGYLTGAAYNLTKRDITEGNKMNFYLDDNLPGNMDHILYSPASNMGHVRRTDDDAFFSNIQKSAPSWEKLDQKKCIQTYANAFISNRRTVVLVSSDKNATNSVLDYGEASMTFTDITKNWWMCTMGRNDGGNQFCNPLSYVANATTWKVSGHPVSYCLSEKVDDVCDVKFSMDIMYFLVGVNALKVITMVWVLFRIKAENILTSVGDAAISFLKYPDPTTFGMCLANKRNITSYWRSQNIARLYEAAASRRWGQGISRKRWFIFSSM